MKRNSSVAVFLYLLISFNRYMIPQSDAVSVSSEPMIAQVSGNDSTILELHQTTPTTIPQKPQKITQVKPTPPAPLTETAISFSQPYLSYGFLIPGDPIIRSDQIYTKTTHESGASLFIIQDGPLKANDSTIPDTTCDDGSCSPNQAGKWISPLTFGAGIRCENSDFCADDFSEPNMFRPLSGTYASSVLKVGSVTHEAQIVYKLNIPASQPPFPYTNKITYVVIPNL